MRKTVIIPTYWTRETENSWKEGDAVYDHPTPLDKEGTLGRTLESMKILSNKDFKLVILICPTSPEIEEKAVQKVIHIIYETKLPAETYLFTASALIEIRKILLSDKINEIADRLLSLSGYANVRNMCLLAASILSSDVAILIDDDEIFEIEDYIPRTLEFLGKRVYGDVVHGVAGYYLNKKGNYYDDVAMEPWMTYWNRFASKAQAFDKIIGSGPRLKRTPFVFGGAMTLSKELFECVPFDPYVTRGEDVDYLVNSRMLGFSFFLDNTLSIKHLPEPKFHPQWKRMREDIFRFVYQRAKLRSQHENGTNVLVYPEDLDPYPGEFLKDDLEEKIKDSSIMLALQYLTEKDYVSAAEALKNIQLCYTDAVPKFDAFSAYMYTQKCWEKMICEVKRNRYALRKIMERNNLSAVPIELTKEHKKILTTEEIKLELTKLTVKENMTESELDILSRNCYVKTFFEEEFLFSKGDFIDSVYLIMKGCVVLLSDLDDVDNFSPIEYARLKKGNLIGEGLVHNTFRLTGQAAEFTELLCIKKDKLDNIMQKHPVLAVKLLKIFLGSMSSKISNSNEGRRLSSKNEKGRVDINGF